MAEIRIRGVTRSFGDNPVVLALRGVDLDIPSGDFLSIQGPSGSGKSTLLNQLALIDAPTSGEIDVDGRPAGDLRESARARLRSDTFGFVFQSFHLMPRRTALENAEVGLLYRGVPRRERRIRASEALSRIGLSERENVETRLLSGGEKQRVAIARAILGGAPVLVADEPTGNLDSETGNGVMQHLQELNKGGTTIVLVTHDQAVASRARRQVYLRDGQIVGATAPTGEDRIVIPSGRRSVGAASKLRFVDVFSESWAANRTRPGRSALQTLSIGIAVALVVIVLGLSATASAQVSGSFDRQRNRQVSVMVPKVMVRSHVVSGIPPDFEARLAAVNGVVATAAVDRLGDVSVANLASDVTTVAKAAAVSNDSAVALGTKVHWAPGHGAVLGRHEVLVGAVAADTLSLGPLELDPAISMAGTTYGVVGVIEDSLVAPDLTNMLIVDRAFSADVSGIDSSEVYLRTLPGAAPQVATQAPVALNPVTADLMEVTAPPDPTSLRNEVQDSVNASLLVLSIVAALAAMLGVANSMLMGVLERVGELGLRRALGALMRHIVLQTSLEAFFIGVVGGLIGLYTGLFMLIGISLGNRWQPVLDLRLAPVALIGGALVGVVGGLPASIRAGRIAPVDALRR